MTQNNMTFQVSDKKLLNVISLLGEAKGVLSIAAKDEDINDMLKESIKELLQHTIATLAQLKELEPEPK